jgi:ABC-type branched-subunit amino acid transport system ATPase component
MILEVRDLVLRNGMGGFPRNVNFSVAEGEVVYLHCRVLLIGTVLLHALFGMAGEVKGEVWFQGVDLLSGLSQKTMFRLRQEISMVYRERGLISFLSVEENIALPLGYHSNISNKELARQVHEISGLLQIQDILQQGVEDLNRVQTRLVNLARALVRRPRLLLVDGVLEGHPDLKDMVVNAIRHYQELHPFAVVMTGRMIDPDFANHVYEIHEDGLVPHK